MRRLIIVVAGVALAVLGCTLGPTAGPVITPGPTPTTGTPAAGGGTGQTSSVLTQDQMQIISRATVQIVAAQEGGGTLQPIRTGSGVLTSAGGQIVTTCTIACDAPVLLILLATDMSAPPEALYRAQVVSFDKNLDLASLQIVQSASGSAINATTLNLPFLQQGDAAALIQGDPLQIFTYPAVSGSRITTTATSVAGFGTGSVGGVQQRVAIRTSAALGAGASGGAAVDRLGRLVGIPTTVDPSAGGAAAAGGGALLVPANLVSNLGGGLGQATTGGTGGTRQPPVATGDRFEPNNDFNQASGPLTSGQTVEAYITPDGDVDMFRIDVATTSPVKASLTGIPSGVDYDLYAYSNGNVVAQSENQNNADEAIEFRPASPGRYYVAVSSFKGSNSSQSYRLVVNFDSGVTAGGGGAVSISGVVINGTTGRPFERGVFGILNPDVTCDQFFNAPQLNMSLVTANASTNSEGRFTLSGVPAGQRYSAFFFTGPNHVCQNNWLNVPAGGGNVTLDPITLAF